MKFRLRVPRPSHEGADYFEQEEWKKKLASEVATVQENHPGADVEVWTMDEHRIGLNSYLAPGNIDVKTITTYKVN